MPEYQTKETLAELLARKIFCIEQLDYKGLTEAQYNAEMSEVDAKIEALAREQKMAA
jgi:hypothetical protein